MASFINKLDEATFKLYRWVLATWYFPFYSNKYVFILVLIWLAERFLKHVSIFVNIKFHSVILDKIISFMPRKFLYLLRISKIFQRFFFWKENLSQLFKISSSKTHNNKSFIIESVLANTPLSMAISGSKLLLIIDKKLETTRKTTTSELYTKCLFFANQLYSHAPEHEADTRWNHFVKASSSAVQAHYAMMIMFG